MKTFLAYPDIILAGNAIKEHCLPVPGTNTFAYRDGWSDERVHREVVEGRGGVKNIENLRLKLGMRLIRPPAPANAEARIAALEAQTAKLQREFDALADALGLPKSE